MKLLSGFFFIDVCLVQCKRETTVPSQSSQSWPHKPIISQPPTFSNKQNKLTFPSLIKQTVFCYIRPATSSRLSVPHEVIFLPSAETFRGAAITKGDLTIFTSFHSPGCALYFPPSRSLFEQGCWSFKMKDACLAAFKESRNSESHLC